MRYLNLTFKFVFSCHKIMVLNEFPRFDNQVILLESVVNCNCINDNILINFTFKLQTYFLCNINSLSLIKYALQ